MTRITSKNARSLTSYLIDTTTPTDGQALLFDFATQTYKPVTVAAHALVSGSGTTYNVDRYDLGGSLTQTTNILGGGNALNFGAFTVNSNDPITYFDIISSGAFGVRVVDLISTSPTFGDMGSLSINQVQTSIHQASGGSGGRINITADDLFIGNGVTNTETSFFFETLSTTFADNTAALAGIEYAADYSATYTARSLVDKSYVDSIVASAKSYQGGYNAVTNTPDLTTPIAGIKAGFVWDNTAVGTFYGEAVEIGDTLTSRVDNPSSLADWTILQTNITAASVKVMYESNGNTNAYTDAAQTKVNYLTVISAVDLNNLANADLANVATNTFKGRASAGTGVVEDLTPTQARGILNVENGATADQTDGEIKIAFDNVVPVVTQVEAEAGTSGSTRQWTPYRVGQAVKALAPELTKSLYLENPLAADDIGIWQPGRAITITKVVYKVTGATSVAFNINNGTDLWAADKVATTTKTTSTTFTTAAMAADAYIRYQASALVGTPTAIEITITYTED